MSTQLQQSRPETDWDGSVPTALDARVLALVVAIAALAASLNLPYGGLPMAAAAFGLLVAVGVAGHVLGQRRLRRLTDELVEGWARRGGRIEDVTRSSNGMRTEWTVHTSDGPVTIGGLALAPISRLTVEWQGISDSASAAEAEAELETLTESLYREIFEFS